MKYYDKNEIKHYTNFSKLIQFLLHYDPDHTKDILDIDKSINKINQ
jgi:hypothetical protein